VFELPGRLRRCLELEEYNEGTFVRCDHAMSIACSLTRKVSMTPPSGVTAYRYYSRTRDVLKMYQHVPSFTNIHNECEAIMKQVAQRLRVRLTAETVRC